MEDLFEDYVGAGDLSWVAVIGTHAASKAHSINNNAASAVRQSRIQHHGELPWEDKLLLE
jgi:hypothetical protein